MSQRAQLTEVAPVRALSLWLAAIGFFMLAIGELLFTPVMLVPALVITGNKEASDTRIRPGWSGYCMNKPWWPGAGPNRRSSDIQSVALASLCYMVNQCVRRPISVGSYRYS